MGGTGGFFRDTDADTLLGRIRDLESSTDSTTFTAELSALLGEVLADANQRSERVAGHLDTIKAALEKYIAGTVDLLFGGSVAKHTYVHGLSDVDALVVLDRSELAESSPREVISYFVDRLRERLPRTVVVQDGFAVRVEFGTVSVDLVPVLRTSNGYGLPSDDLSTWSRVRPKAFTDRLTAANQATNKRLVPVIKLAKALLAALPESRQPSGYHVENLAIEAFRGYTGKYTTHEMVQHFFDQAPNLILRPITDKTGQSRHVDDYLGAEGSTQRLITSDAVGRIGRRMKLATASQSIEQWEKLLGGP